MHDAAAFSDGTSPGACLDVVAGPGDVVVLVERLQYAGQPATAFVLVGPDGPVAAIVDVEGCATLATVPL